MFTITKIRKIKVDSFTKNGYVCGVLTTLKNQILKPYPRFPAQQWADISTNTIEKTRTPYLII